MVDSEGLKRHVFFESCVFCVMCFLIHVFLDGVFLQNVFFAF